eukprot:2578963-Karenia_brevis.AAC.1
MVGTLHSSLGQIGHDLFAIANEVGIQRSLFGQLQGRLTDQENKHDKQLAEMTTKMDDLQNKMLGQEHY